MSLKRRHQIFASAESQAGVAVSGIRAAANGDFLVIDPVVTYEPDIYERDNINRESLSNLQPITGVVTGTCSFQLELSGRAAAGGAPSWGILLQACGWTQGASDRISIGAVGGAEDCFFHGETITGGTSSATGTVIHQTFNGQTTLRFVPVSGTFQSGELLTGGTSNATATTTSTPTDDGFAWYPVSTELQTFLATPSGPSIAAGVTIVGDTSKAVAVLNTAITNGGAQTVVVRMLDGNFSAAETTTNSDGTTLTIDSAPSFTLSQVPSLTLSIIEDGRYKELNGCRGTVSFSGAIGEPVMMNFEFKGIVGGEGDAGAIPGVTYSALIPNALLGVVFSVGDDSDATQAAENSPRLQSFSLTHGSDLGIPRDAGQSTGVYDSAHQTARSSEGSIVINVSPESNFDFINKLKGGAAVRQRLVIGSNQDAFRFTIPGAVLTGESGGESEGIATVDYSLRLGSRNHDGTDSSNGEIVLSYTNA